MQHSTADAATTKSQGFCSLKALLWSNQSLVLQADFAAATADPLFQPLGLITKQQNFFHVKVS